MRFQRPLDGGAAALTEPGRVRAVESDEVGGLVRASQSGSRDAFGRLYERFAAYVHAILLARLPSQDTPDLVQDVFVTAFQRLSALRDPAAFPAWIAAIARNRAVDFLRRRPMDDELLDQASRSDPQEARIDAARALAAIKQLPDAYRETLILRLVEGLTGPEIARVTGLTPASVRVNLHRGFKLLRESLGQTT